MLEYKN
jgi:signal transduction histidine kinase